MHPLIKRLLIHMNLYPPLAMTYIDQSSGPRNNSNSQVKQDQDKEDSMDQQHSWSRTLETPQHLSIPAA